MTPEERVAAKRAKSQRWRDKNPDAHRQWVAENRDRHNANNRDWRRRHPGYDTATRRAYNARNLAMSRELNRRAQVKRRAVLLGAVTIPFTREQLSARIAFFGEKCWMCGGLWDSLDHVKPLSREPASRL
jgi:hypothetical protein